MSHSLTKIWIHAIFGTKDREPIISKNFEEKLHKHIKDHIERDFECPIHSIHGTSDHIHLLFLLNPNHSVKDILQNIKGESSHWINQENLTKSKFVWQTGYAAFSVSESNIKLVNDYITKQKEHHKKMTFIEEYQKFIEKHGLLINS